MGAQRETGIGGTGDGFRLAALFGADAGIGAGGVHQRDHRHVEAIRQFHQAHGLPVSLGAGHAEIVPDAGLGGGALLMAYHAHRFAAEAGEAANDGLVLAELAVAGERGEFLEQALGEIGEVRPHGMAGHQGLLPGGEARIELGEGLGCLGLQALHVVGDGNAVPGGQGTQFFHLRLELGHRLLEVQIAAHACPLRF